MIITRTPFRVSFAGGGSDLAAFYEKEPGYVLSTSIDKYMYIALHPYYDEKKTLAKYSRTELVDDVAQFEHPIIRQCLLDMGIQGVDINSIADIPGGTGLGSSSSFTVSLLHALHTYKNQFVSHDTLAEEACHIEIDKLKEPIGKQDQYAAAHGGLNFFSFYPDGSVGVEKILLSSQKRMELQNSLVIFYTGKQRSTREILQEQKKNTEMSSKKFDNVRAMTKLAWQLKKTLNEGNIEDFGAILHEGWLLKKELATGISSESIDYYYDLGIKNGALGGKLLGAGGGGFLLFCCPNEKQAGLRMALSELKELPFEFDLFGSQVVFVR